MRRQIEEWHPTGIQVAGEKKIKIESRRRQQKHGVLQRCVYLYLCMVGTILTFRLDLGMKFRVLPVAGVLLLFVLLAILKSIWRPWGRWVYRGAYLLIFLTGGLGWKHLAAGWQAAENSIRHQLSVYYGVTLAEKTPLLSGERGELLLIPHCAHHTHSGKTPTDVPCRQYVTMKTALWLYCFTCVKRQFHTGDNGSSPE